MRRQRHRGGTQHAPRRLLSNARHPSRCSPTPTHLPLRATPAGPPGRAQRRVLRLVRRVSASWPGRARGAATVTGTPSKVPVRDWDPHQGPVTGTPQQGPSSKPAPPKLATKLELEWD